MGSIYVYLENGFDHDRVAVTVAGREVEETDVTTRYQIGLARVVELAVPGSRPAAVRVAVPDRGLAAEATADASAAPHLRVNVADGRLSIESSSAPPMFA